MKYRATVTFEFDAFDQPALKQREQDLAEWLAAFEQRFGPAVLTIKVRRPRTRPRAPAPRLVWDGPGPGTPGLGRTPPRG